ncbi:hypothetical protein ABTM38_19865, partial [Acinetobacter baumannii]
NSWPAGLAIALLTLPAIGTAYGLSAVYLAVAALIALGIVLLAFGYPAPSAAAAASAGAASPLERNALIALVVASLIWGVFNI